MLEYTLDSGQTPRFFTRLFSRLFNCSYFRNVYQLKLFAITNIFPSNETLLRMLSLDFFDKVAKRVDVHSTTIPLLDFLTKIKLYLTSLNSTRFTQQGGQTAQFISRFFCRVKDRVKNRVVWPGPYISSCYAIW